MRSLNIIFCILLLALFSQVIPQQSPVKKTTAVLGDDKLLAAQALDLVLQVGQQSAELVDIRQKLYIEIGTSEMLWPHDDKMALQLLDRSWRDTFSDKIDNEYFRDSIRKRIIEIAARKDPARAAKWRKEITKEKPDDDTTPSDSPPATDRQKADVTVRTALSIVKNDPEQAVAVALTSLQSTNTISAELRPLSDELAASDRGDLVRKLYLGVEAYVRDRTTNDPLDICAVISLLFGSSATAEDRSVLLQFLLTSVRQIVILQNSPQPVGKQSPDDLIGIYRIYALVLRPFVQQFMPVDMAILDATLDDLESLIPSDALSDPLLSRLTIDKQIENAEKTIGSKERDKRLCKIASFLLSRRMREKADSLSTTGKIADRLSDMDLKATLRDYIKLAQIEIAVEKKTEVDTDKLINTISRSEIRAWALMGLAGVEKSPQIAQAFLEDASTALLKSGPSNYKLQLALDLASSMLRFNKTTTLDYFDNAIDISRHLKDDSAKKDDRSLLFTSSIGDLNFEDSDLDITVGQISVPSQLGQLSKNNWGISTSSASRAQPLYLKLQIEMILAGSILSSDGKVK